MARFVTQHRKTIAGAASTAIVLCGFVFLEVKKKAPRWGLFTSSVLMSATTRSRLAHINFAHWQLGVAHTGLDAHLVRRLRVEDSFVSLELRARQRAATEQDEQHHQARVFVGRADPTERQLRGVLVRVRADVRQGPTATHTLDVAFCVARPAHLAAWSERLERQLLLAPGANPPVEFEAIHN